jgi:integrase
VSKRTNGEGTVWQDKRGLWRGEITLGYEVVDDRKKRIKKAFSSKDREKLLQLMNNERHNINRNIIIKNSDYTVAEWIKFWLENYKSNTLKSKTYDNYEYALNCHIKNNIGDIKLNKIRPDTVQQLYNQMHRRGFSTSTIRITHVTLSQAFEQAIKNELIYNNPCNATIRPKSEKKKATALSVQQQEIFLSTCKDSTFHKFFIFLLYTGLRMGEGQSLIWDDIDFEKNTISVNKTASVVINRDEDALTKHKTIISSAKTQRSVRTVPMNKRVMTILLEMKRKANDSPFVFSSKTGTMLGARNISRALSNLLNACGLPKEISVHTLRHTFATRLLEKGVNPKVASDLLGHASVQITLDVYSHVMPNVKFDAVNLLD